MAAAVAAIWMGRSTVDEMVKPAVDLREQKAGAEGGSETKGGAQPRRTRPGKPTGAKVAEASKEGVGPITRTAQVERQIFGVEVWGRMDIDRHPREPLCEPSVCRTQQTKGNNHSRGYDDKCHCL